VEPGPPLGIIGSPGDEQVMRVARRLSERAAEPLILNLRTFPATPRLSLLDGVPSVAGIDVTTVRSWYVRSIPLPLPFLTASPRHYAAGREQRSFVTSFVAALGRAGASFVNPPERFGQHFLKLEQLERLRAAGVPVPQTLATNDPAAVVDFAHRIGGTLVYKPVAGGGLCRRVTQDDLGEDRLRRLASAPVLFQEEIPGRNVRVYVVGGEVVAVYEIISTEVDYRGSETAVVPIDATDDEGKACRRAAEACALVFTGIDLKRKPDGSFAVLEGNPSPMFAAIERRTGQSAVSSALADHLLRAAGDGPTPQGTNTPS
jgi:glutathione synthase/RimK-type ligase-like ATP-grasp enzyme